MSSGVIAKGQYRITELLCEAPGYQATKCADLLDREHREVIVNRYTANETIRAILPVLQQAKEMDMPEFLELSTEAGTVNAVFTMPKGVPLSKLYGKKSLPKRDCTNALAQSFFHELLELGNMPLAILNTASAPGNVFVQEKTRTTALRMIIGPDTDVAIHDVMQNVRLCMDRLFPKRWTSLSYELDFLDDIPGMSGITALYSRWLMASGEYETYGSVFDEKSGLAWIMALLSDRGKRAKKLRQLKKRGQQGITGDKEDRAK